VAPAWMGVVAQTVQTGALCVQRKPDGARVPHCSDCCIAAPIYTTFRRVGPGGVFTPAFIFLPDFDCPTAAVN
jgi:hypothetical protein